MVRQDEVFFQLQSAAGARERRAPPLGDGAPERRATPADPTDDAPAPAPLTARDAPRRGSAHRQSRCSASPRARIRGSAKPSRLIASARDRRKAGSCVLEGEHLVGVYCGAVRCARDADRHRRSAGSRPGARALAEREPAAHAGRADGAVRASSRRCRPAWACSRSCRRRRRRPSAPADFCLLLDDVQDPGNVGSMLRSAAAAGVATGAAVEALRVRVVAQGAARGAGRAFPARHLEDVDLAGVGGRLCAGGRRGDRDGRRGRRRASTRRPSPGGSRWRSATKAPGCRRRSPRRRRDGSRFRCRAAMESLNAAAAAAVCLFECVRQRAAAGAATS